MFNDFGFYEILMVAAIAFVAYRMYQKSGKIGTETIILIVVAVYLLWSGVSSSSPDFGVNP
jgi:uncharacterized membrane protein